MQGAPRLGIPSALLLLLLPAAHCSVLAAAQTADPNCNSCIKASPVACTACIASGLTDPVSCATCNAANPVACDARVANNAGRFAVSRLSVCKGGCHTALEPVLPYEYAYGSYMLGNSLLLLEYMKVLCCTLSHFLIGSAHYLPATGWWRRRRWWWQLVRPKLGLGAGM